MKSCLLMLAIFISLSAEAFWDQDKFYAKHTQSLKAEVAGEGVLLLKHFKYGNPVYLVSTFEEQTVTKTRMVSKKYFYSLYNHFYRLLPSQDDARSCEKKVAVTVNLDPTVSKERELCMEKNDRKSKKSIKDWFVYIKNKL